MLAMYIAGLRSLSCQLSFLLSSCQTQCFCSSCVIITWRCQQLIPSVPPTCNSHSRYGSSQVLHGCPSSPEFRVQPHLFRTLVLERLRLPLHVAEARCECHEMLDCQGRHRAACSRSGTLRTRAIASEKTLARVCREAGATVRCNCKLRDMDIAVPANDERAVEVLAAGLPLHHGAQLAVDITLRFDRERHSAPQCGSGGWRNLQEGPPGQGTEVF